VKPAVKPAVLKRSVFDRFTPRDTLYVAALGYIAGTWIGIHLALV
jgi:hypothetical protein